MSERRRRRSGTAAATPDLAPASTTDPDAAAAASTSPTASTGSGGAAVAVEGGGGAAACRRPGPHREGGGSGGEEEEEEEEEEARRGTAAAAAAAGAADDEAGAVPVDAPTSPPAEGEATRPSAAEPYVPEAAQAARSSGGGGDDGREGGRLRCFGLRRCLFFSAVAAASLLVVVLVSCVAIIAYRAGGIGGTAAAGEGGSGGGGAVLTARGGEIMLIFGMYPVRAADFGMEVPDDAQINVLYAPVGSNNSLCEYPFHDGKNTTADDLRALAPAFNVPIALLLNSSNQCSTEQQALVARKIQQRIKPKILYIIVQGKPDDGDYLQVLSPNGEDFNNELGDSIGVLYITYRTGSFVQQQVARRQAMWGGSPYLMDPSGRNFEWSLITNIEKYTPPNRDGGSGGNRNGSRSSDSFYWSRVLLFTLLMVLWR